MERNQGRLPKWLFAQIMELKGIGPPQLGVGWFRFSFRSGWGLLNGEKSPV